MFWIEVTVTGMTTLRGVQCLDFCRANGLRDCTYIEGETWVTDVCVDEAFAREYFPIDRSVVRISLPYTSFRKGDLGIERSRIVFRNNPERAKELYIAYVKQKLEQKIEDEGKGFLRKLVRFFR